jgi:release factor glutamine methyltransferase
MATIGAAWRAASQRIDRLDARLLLEHLAGCSHADLIARPETVLSADLLANLESLVERRAVGEPLAYLLGTQPFYGREFLVSPAVLIPRPDTEVLVDVALEKAARMAAPSIVDLGTGSGVVAVTLACLCPAARLTAVDCSPAAIEVAQANARRHGVQIDFRVGDWVAPLGDARFDLMVSNPPYVAEGDAHLQQNGLPFEPRAALTDGVAGGDGLACLRRIVGRASAHLRPGGWLLLEHGYDQAAQVRDLLDVAGLVDVASWRDLAMIERVSGGRQP